MGLCSGEKKKKTEVRWICLLLLLQCYDQSNEICGDLGLSFCCITHTLSCTRKPTVELSSDTSTQMDGCIRWCSRQQSIIQYLFMVYIQAYWSPVITGFFCVPKCCTEREMHVFIKVSLLTSRNINDFVFPYSCKTINHTPKDFFLFLISSK